MKEIKLKPCPFCGGEAKIKAVINNIGLRIWCECHDCGTESENHYPLRVGCDETMENIERIVEITAEKWNRRAGDTA